ncbi:MAG: hypothetical protein IJN92_10090 [Lachnospiraceae bacterium]|nr:hypothetical protein [Lachnospiraceae bacterium]
MTVYMEVTQDEYELPVAVADTVEELAKMRGTTIGSILSTISKYKCGKRKKIKYLRVDLD